MVLTTLPNSIVLFLLELSVVGAVPADAASASAVANKDGCSAIVAVLGTVLADMLLLPNIGAAVELEPPNDEPPDCNDGDPNMDGAGGPLELEPPPNILGPANWLTEPKTDWVVAIADAPKKLELATPPLDAGAELLPNMEGTGVGVAG